MAYMNPMGFGIPPISNIGLTSGIGSPGPIQSWFTQFLGLSSLFGLGSTILSAAGGGEAATNPVASTTARLFVLGVLIEMGRRFMQWLMQRLNFRAFTDPSASSIIRTDTGHPEFCITAQFDHGDPAYEWILLFLTQEKIWKRTRDFKVTAHNSRRKWGIKPGADAGIDVEENADYVPTYEMPQIFRWRGHWVEVRRDKGFVSAGPGMPPGGGGSIYLRYDLKIASKSLFTDSGVLSTRVLTYILGHSIYSLNMAVLSALVEDARQRYIEVSRPHVTIHMADSVGGSSASLRMMAALSNRRHRTVRIPPLSSLLLTCFLLCFLLV
jgi:mitochondrial chaperone BCS1